MNIRKLTYNQYYPLLHQTLWIKKSIITDNPILPLILEHTFRFQSVYMCVRENDEVVAMMSANIIGRKLVSIPHFSYGSLQINPAFDDKLEEIIECISLHYPEFEIRFLDKLTSIAGMEKVSSFLTLRENKERQWKVFSSDLRRKVKKVSCQLSVISYPLSEGYLQRQEGGLNRSLTNQALKDFFFVYKTRMKQLGSPHLSFEFFKKLVGQYENGVAEIFVTYLDDKPVGAAFNLEYNGFYENCWFATLDDYNDLKTSYALHWNMIQRAINLKCHTYSFGRSTKNSGVHQYKKQWATRDIQLFWNYSREQKVNLRKLNWTGKVWSKLPGVVSDWLGPQIAKRVY